MDDAERGKRTDQAIRAEEANPKPGMYWLSFADDDGWLGGCMVEAVGPISAIRRSHELGINPGGEVATLGPAPADRLPMEMADRLLTRADLEGDELIRFEEI